MPLVQLRDTLVTCDMFDQCHRYVEDTPDGVYEFFKENFDRHYKLSRSPLPLFGHFSWVGAGHVALQYKKEGKKCSWQKFGQLHFLPWKHDIVSQLHNAKSVYRAESVRKMLGVRRRQTQALSIHIKNAGAKKVLI